MIVNTGDWDAAIGTNTLDNQEILKVLFNQIYLRIGPKISTSQSTIREKKLKRTNLVKHTCSLKKEPQNKIKERRTQ